VLFSLVVGGKEAVLDGKVDKVFVGPGIVFVGAGIVFVIFVVFVGPGIVFVRAGIVFVGPGIL